MRAERGKNIGIKLVRQEMGKIGSGRKKRKVKV